MPNGKQIPKKFRKKDVNVDEQNEHTDMSEEIELKNTRYYKLRHKK